MFLLRRSLLGGFINAAISNRRNRMRSRSDLGNPNLNPNPVAHDPPSCKIKTKSEREMVVVKSVGVKRSVVVKLQFEEAIVPIESETT
ncbi:hypothetical protein F2Q68_00045784 [Brassica cretica]|uniref:Uncharacterized protein n=2 Tax=Brassica cretica TaxID=69181 RepID=A0ABQ7ATP6_BRACR|nr:hypothetical protein F2Q68_00045784 [Brassica cretica]KAF3517344.1 hypothetical protein DY000_02062859 [Brassica cretica]